MRIVLNAPKVLLSSVFMLASLLVLPGITSAAGLTIQGGMTAKDFFKLDSGSIRTVDFGRGSSQFYDNGDLHVVTDDLMYLQAATVSVSNKLDVTGDLVANYPIYAKGNQINFGGGSNIQDNSSGTLSTYSKGVYYVTAPTVSLSNDLDVTKNATIQGNLTANGTFAVRNDANDATTFSVANNTGNTDIAGTLNVKDAAVFNGWLDATSGLTVDSGGMDVNLDGGVVFRRSDDDALGGAVTISKDRAKGAVQSGDQLGYLSFNGMDTAGASSMGAYIMSTTSGTIGNQLVPADFEVYTQPNIAKAQQQRFVISPAGTVSINAPETGNLSLSVAGVPGTAFGVQFNTGLVFGSGSPTGRAIKIGDYSADNTAAPALTIQASNQTKSGGGNGGNLVLQAGSSASATAGLVTIGVANTSLISLGQNTTMASGKKLAFDTSSVAATGDPSSTATLNVQSGVVTTPSLAELAGGKYTLTLTDSEITSSSNVLAFATMNSATTGMPYITKVTPGTGNVVIVVTNIDPTVALNGTVNISFLVTN